MPGCPSSSLPTKQRGYYIAERKASGILQVTRISCFVAYGGKRKGKKPGRKPGRKPETVVANGRRAGGITLEDIQAVKALADSIGAEKVQQLALVLSK